MNRHLLILGTRGLPAKHGGFETFAERLALYLVNKGWKVTVYCQTEGNKFYYQTWQGINLVYIPIPQDNAIGSIIFDLKATLHAIRQKGIVLVLGYNTAILSILHRLKKQTNIINMDGLEWRRQKWNALEKTWLYLNERLGIWFSNHMIADHPEIKNHLLNYGVDAQKITIIPYGTEQVVSADRTCLEKYALCPDRYLLVIARPEPENSILEIVSAFSQRKWGLKLVVLGRYLPKIFPYHKQVLQVASDEVIFPGAIYDKEAVTALRFYARLYIHGHTVGGTNPSLVEALATGTPILAHDNYFNRWVAGSGTHYFRDKADCLQKLEQLLDNEQELEKMRKASISRYREEFSENRDLKAYEDLLLSQLSPKTTGEQLKVILSSKVKTEG